MLGWLVVWSGVCVCASGHTCLNIRVFPCVLMGLHEHAHASELIPYVNDTTKQTGGVCNREIDSLMNGNPQKREKNLVENQVSFLVFVWSHCCLFESPR